MSFNQWAPYVSVAKRRARAQRVVAKLRKQGKHIEPVEVAGRKIARSFWGEGWCKQLEQFSDYDNRLPRGRTYVRNGSVAHLAISKGKIEALVIGSTLYHVDIAVKPLSRKKWKILCQQCTGRIGSMLELLQGQLSNQVMQIVTDPKTGLFPDPDEITLCCDCPDWADMCKHIAAVLYGIAARLDHQPELLFVLRNVDHEALISAELDMQTATSSTSKRRRLTTQNLSNVFGVDIEETVEHLKRKKSSVSKKAATRKAIKKKTAAEKAVVKKTITKKASIMKTLAHEPRLRKMPPREVIAKKVPARKTTKKTSAKTGIQAFNPSATSIARLRIRLGLTQAQFARLLGVSLPSVNNWENAVGKLKLRGKSTAALNRVALLGPAEAMQALSRMG
jgi:uncharacterized Zn finger protein/DNA-binding XRE family transcriptional regulator